MQTASWVRPEEVPKPNNLDTRNLSATFFYDPTTSWPRKQSKHKIWLVQRFEPRNFEYVRFFPIWLDSAAKPILVCWSITNSTSRQTETSINATFWFLPLQWWWFLSEWRVNVAQIHVDSDPWIEFWVLRCHWGTVICYQSNPHKKRWKRALCLPLWPWPKHNNTKHCDPICLVIIHCHVQNHAVELACIWLWLER